MHDLLVRSMHTPLHVPQLVWGILVSHVHTLLLSALTEFLIWCTSWLLAWKGQLGLPASTQSLGVEYWWGQ